MALFNWPWSKRKLNERLFDVAFEGDSEEVMALLKKGADPNIKNDAGVTALIRTSLKGHTQVVQALLNHGADVNARADNGGTALLAATISGHATTLRTLLDKNTDSVTVDARERREGYTALVLAAKDGHIDIVRWLLEAGANPNIPSNAGMTALIHAAGGGYTEMVTELLDHEAEPNAQTKNGLTALMAAAIDGHSDNVHALLDRKANPDACTKDGKTALLWAVFNGHLKVVKALLDGGADVNARLNTGETSLMGAAYHGYKQMIEWLFERGAHLDAKDRKIALDWAREQGHTDVIPLLTSKGEPSSISEIHQTAERQPAQQNNPFSEKIFNFLDENPLSIGTLDEFKKGREDFSSWGDGILTGSKEWVVNKLCIKLSEIGVNNPPSIIRSQNYEWQTSNLEDFTARIEASLPNMLAGYYIGRIGDNLYGLFGCNLNKNETENPAHLPQ